MCEHKSDGCNNSACRHPDIDSQVFSEVRVRMSSSVFIQPNASPYCGRMMNEGVNGIIHFEILTFQRY